MPLAPPLVYWDAFGFHEAGGIRRYSECLHAGLALEGLTPIRLSRLSQPDSLQVPLPTHKVSQKLTASKILWPDLAFRQALKHANGRPFIFHGLANCDLPFFLRAVPKNAGFVLTVHDLIPLLPASGVSLTYKAQFNVLLPKALERADRVLCVSKWTLEQLLERYPGVHAKCRVVPHGLTLPASRPFSLQAEQLAREQAGEKNQLLCVTRCEPYKRIPWLISIMAALPEAFQLNLVCDAKGLALVRKTAARQVASAKIRLFSGLPEIALQGLYAKAQLYVHPSLYEGYCLPAFEALAQHTPVLYQKGSALDGLLSDSVARGMGAGAGLEAWVETIKTLVKLKAKPTFQMDAQAFLNEQPSWQDSAKAVKKVYESLA